MEYDHLCVGNEWTYSNDIIGMTPKEVAPSASIETITPDTAKRYLEMSVGNRNIKPQKVNGLIRDMKSNTFCLNGEAIIFSSTGELMDGHHRLTACARSGVTIESVVVRNIQRSFMRTMDVGSARSNADHLKIDGFKYTTLIPIMVNTLVAMKTGNPHVSTVTSNELYDFIEKYPFIRDSASNAANVKVPRVRALCAVIHFVARLNGESDVADRYINVIKTGIPDYVGCPAHAMRERIYREECSGKMHRATTIPDLRRIFFKTWEFFRRGEPLKVLIPKGKPYLTGWTEV